MKKSLSFVLSTALFIGCGGGSSSGSSNKTLKVIDAYVVGAKVCDDNGVCAISDKNGTVSANFNQNSPLTSVGGFIDANFDGIQDNGEIEAPLMKTPADAKVITPLTTLVANGADLNKLEEVTGLSADEILNEDPLQTKNTKLIKIINAIYPVLKENRVNSLILKINSYGNVNTVLPDFSNSVANATIYDLVVSSLTSPDDKTFVNTIRNIDENNFDSLITTIENYKKNPVIETTTQSIQQNTTGNSGNNGDNISSNTISTVSSTVSSTVNTSNTVTSESSNLLPDFSSSNTATYVSLEPSSSSTLPDFSDNNVEAIPTNNTYNPQYTPLPPMYYIKLMEFTSNDFVELTKISDTHYSFKNIKYFNVNNSEFNATKFFDINASYIFKDNTFSPDGNLNGTIFITLKDNNDSSEVNFTIPATFKVVNSKIDSITLNGTMDINYTSNSGDTTSNTKTINNVVFTQFETNLTKVLSDYNESDFNQTNHIYNFKLDYNISNSILTLDGKYGVVNLITPTITLNSNSFIVAKDTDINISLGTTNLNDIGCSVDGVSLNCNVENNGSDNVIYLYGHTPDEEAIRVVSVTLSNQGITNSKSFYLEILKPADNVIVTDWNLSSSADGNYTGKHIQLGLVGNLDNNIVEVNTSASLSDGNPDNNVTVYLCNSSSDCNNYIKFIFDAEVYSPNDWFIIKRGDNKKVRFRVGDVSSSNNSFSFK